MFYSHQLLARKAPLGQIWLVSLLSFHFRRISLFFFFVFHSNAGDDGCVLRKSDSVKDDQAFFVIIWLNDTSLEFFSLRTAAITDSRVLSPLYDRLERELLLCGDSLRLGSLMVLCFCSTS